LATVWAAQAGKHVYVEKPVSHNIFEGRRMVDAGNKYKVHIQHGASPARGEAMDFLLGGGIGKVYMVRGLCLHRRDSYGYAGKDKDTTPPEGFHYDQWLGPAPFRPYNEKRSHYCWHWYWDTGCGDTGNTGPHAIHSAITGIQKNHEHPVAAFSNGGLYGFREDEVQNPGVMSYGDVETYGNSKTTQETPNTQMCYFKYADGTIFVFDTRGWYSNTEGENHLSDGLMFYGTDGYMEYSGAWKAFRKGEKQPFAGAGIGSSKPQGERGAGRPNLFTNFLDVIRSGRDEDLINPIITGHHGASLVHLANISYRLGGRSLRFDKDKEKFLNDTEANALLTRNYRKPFIVPDKV
jgi:predicted dehydrogenase